MTRATPIEPTPSRTAGRRESGSSFTQRRPLTAFLLLVFGIGLPLLSIPAITGIPTAPFLLVLVFLVLLVPALVVTRLADGPGAVRRLLSRVLIWRFSLGRWAVIVLGMPVLTLAVAAATGSLESPDEGWASEATTYLLRTFIIGAVSLNVWEETAWAGFAQSRLTARHGLLIASVLTALPFAVIHLPLQFEEGWTWSEVGRGVAFLFAGAPFYRYLLGMHMLDTGGSVLAAGVQHASWNAVASRDFIQGDWQPFAAAMLLTLLVAVGRRLWRPEARPMGREAEKGAAAEWIAARSPRADSLARG